VESSRVTTRHGSTPRGGGRWRDMGQGGVRWHRRGQLVQDGAVAVCSTLGRGPHPMSWAKNGPFSPTGVGLALEKKRKVG
jgi:hypothetical protein